MKIISLLLGCALFSSTVFAYPPYPTPPPAPERWECSAMGYNANGGQVTVWSARMFSQYAAQQDAMRLCERRQLRSCRIKNCFPAYHLNEFEEEFFE